MTDVRSDNTRKGLTQPTVGGDNSAWGGLLNTDLSLIDSALGGTLAKSISGSVTLTSTEAQNGGYEFTGSLSGTATITWPAFSGFAAIENGTTGGHSITCGIAGGTVSVLAGETVAIWSDGTNFARLAQVGGGIGATGSGQVVLATSPTLTTPTAASSLTTPKVLGGSLSTSQLTVQSTTGSWAGADEINFITATDLSGDSTLSVISNPSGTGGIGLRLWAGNHLGPQNVEFDVVSSLSADGGIAFRALGNPPIQVAFHAPIAGTVPASISIYSDQNTGSANHVTLQAPVGMSASWTWALPAAPGNVGDIVVTTSSPGVTKFATVNGVDVPIRIQNGSGILDENAVGLIGCNTTPSAVNYLAVANAATGNAPILTATGSDTNVTLNIAGKGTSGVNLSTAAGGTTIASFANSLVTFNQPLALPAGSSGTPAIAIGTGAGIFQPASNELEFRINSANKLDFGATNASSWTAVGSVFVSGGKISTIQASTTAGAFHQTGAGSDYVVQIINESTNAVSSIWSSSTTAGTPNATFVNFLNSSGATTVGSISYNGTVTAFNTTSDARLKIDRGIATDVGLLEKIKVHDFVWRANGVPDVGIFAQELAVIKPSAVTRGDDDEDVSEPWQVNYPSLVADLIVGWQHHEARIKALEEKSRS